MAEETITAQTPEIDPGMSVMPEGPGLMDVPTVIPELDSTASTLESAVSFAKKTWKDGSGGGTPITAAELNRLEQGVADLTAAVTALRDSVSQCVQAPGASLPTIGYSKAHANFVINIPERFTGSGGTEYKAVNIVFKNDGCRVTACRADNGEWGPIA